MTRYQIMVELEGREPEPVATNIKTIEKAQWFVRYFLEIHPVGTRASITRLS